MKLNSNIFRVLKIFFLFINCQDDIYVEELVENIPDYNEFFITTTNNT